MKLKYGVFSKSCYLYRNAAKFKFQWRFPLLSGKFIAELEDVIFQGLNLVFSKVIYLHSKKILNLPQSHLLQVAFSRKGLCKYPVFRFFFNFSSKIWQSLYFENYRLFQIRKKSYTYGSNHCIVKFKPTTEISDHELLAKSLIWPRSLVVSEGSVKF